MQKNQKQKKHRKYHNLIRDTDGPNYGEVFLVTSVTTIIATRTFLHLTGYPQVGNETLHIAHMLWGGMFMLISIMILLTYVNIQLKWFASLLAGIGFGLFIDELGKFLTSDNNYFFKPTFAIMYGIFLVIFFTLQFLQEHTVYTKEEIKANEEIKKISDRDSNAFFPAMYIKFSSKAQTYIDKIVKSRWFEILLVSYFFLTALFDGIAMFWALFIPEKDLAELLPKTHMPEVLGTIAYNILVLIGVYLYIRKSHYRAYHYFRYATYVSLFVLQFYTFLESQLLGILGFVISLLALASINYIIRKHEKDKKSRVAG